MGSGRKGVCVGEGEEGIRFRCEGGPIHLSQGRRRCPCKFNRNNPLIINEEEGGRRDEVELSKAPNLPFPGKRTLSM